MVAHIPHFFTHTTSLATNQVLKHDAHQSYIFPVYISFSKGMEHSYWCNPTLTSCGPCSMMPQIQLSHNVIPQL